MEVEGGWESEAWALRIQKQTEQGLRDTSGRTNALSEFEYSLCLKCEGVHTKCSAYPERISKNAECKIEQIGISDRASSTFSV
jgi:hypothetical protein